MYMLEQRDGEIRIHKGDSFENAICRVMYPYIGEEHHIDTVVDLSPDSRILFKLVYNRQIRMIGYQLKYDTTRPHVKKCTFNSLSLFFSRKKDAKPDSLELLYDDQVIRMLSYIHPTKGVRDYELIGRWRTESKADEGLDIE